MAEKKSTLKVFISFCNADRSLNNKIILEFNLCSILLNNIVIK